MIPHICLLVEVLLQQMGCDSVAISRELAGFSGQCQAHQIAGLIIDPYSNGEDCFTLINHVRGMQPHLPVIVMSATLEACDAFEAGATAFLPKPFTVTDFMSLARHVFCPQYMHR
jgi:DNA-binding NtrC family response regulator